MSKLRKVLLLSHLPYRDEIVDNLIARELDAHGICVWKYPILSNPRKAICMIQPDMVILPEIRIEFSRDLAKQCQEWGIRVIQRRGEMGVSSETPMTDELERCLFGNVDWEKYVDLDIVWGQGFADMLVKHGVSKDKIFVAGGLGFDQYFLPQLQQPRGKKPRILFAGGFGYAELNPLYAIPESKIGEKINIDVVKKDRENRIAFLQMIEQVIDYFGDKFEYGVRGHPGEKFNFYSKVLGNKIKCVEGTVTPLALGWCDILIHPGSTMAYEMHLLNKPSFNFRNTNLDVIVGNIAPLFKTAKALIKHLEKVELGKSNARKKVIKDLKRYYGDVDGLAYKRATEAMLKLEKRKTSIPQDWPKDEIKYPNKLAYTNLTINNCGSCGNLVFIPKHLRSSKCPWCGIAIVQKVITVEK